METITAMNHSEFLYQAIRLILNKGKTSTPRGMEILEVENVLYEIVNPSHKHLFIPLRKNNPIATIAEVLWMLAGRNDMEYLSFYLPRAVEFSDDGTTWRGAYGPRLRNWNGIDQLERVVQILETDRESRRAVMMIFDPDRDFVDSKDIPCNNQLAFTIRDNKLNAKVCSRSMDVLWGSTVDTITWCILQEIMSGILDAEMGTLVYFVSSFHLYAEFIERVKAMLASEGTSTPYHNASIPVLRFDKFKSVSELDSWILEIMNIEEQIRNGTYYDIPRGLDLLSRQIISSLVAWRYLHEGNAKVTKQIVANMDDTDFSRAIAYYVNLRL